MNYVPAATRYEKMLYRRSGRSGLMLPAISLGLWNNFGHDVPAERSRRILFTAFDLGITHFDLANNYGPPPGSAERFFGRSSDPTSRTYRDELIVSTKAGWKMWDGPYGDWGSRKYLLASLDQSLKRMGLDYVDIFYSHRFDPNTPLEETMGALDAAVRQGKALYVGVSSYTSAQTAEAAAILRRLGTPAVIHQPRYSMFDRWTERDRLLDRLEAEGMGCISFSPLAQGVLTDRYLDGIPADSRAAAGRFLSAALDHRREGGPCARAEGDRRAPRADAGADGARLGAARPAHDVRPHRREPPRAGRGRRRRSGEPRVLAQGARRNRAECRGGSMSRRRSFAAGLAQAHRAAKLAERASLRIEGLARLHGMPAEAATPGTVSTGIPAAPSASISSGSRPKNGALPDFSSTT